MATEDLTTTQVAARLGVGKSTVNLWVTKGLFPNARRENTPRGPVYLIPERDVRDFKPPRMGRPPKPKREEKKIA